MNKLTCRVGGLTTRAHDHKNQQMKYYNSFPRESKDRISPTLLPVMGSD